MSDSENAQKHRKVCDCGNDEFYFTKDLNLDKAWKAGNKFARICTECGNRYFLSKAMYQAASDQFVILDGEDDPIPIFDCPKCGEQVTGQPDSCPYCDVEYQWPDEQSDDQSDDDSATDYPSETPPADSATDEADEAAADGGETDTSTSTSSTSDQ